MEVCYLRQDSCPAILGSNHRGQAMCSQELLFLMVSRCFLDYSTVSRVSLVLDSMLYVWN